MTHELTEWNNAFVACCAGP